MCAITLSHSRRFRVKVTKRTTRTEIEHSESTVVETVEEDFSVGGRHAVDIASGALGPALKYKSPNRPAVVWHHPSVFYIEYPASARREGTTRTRVFANGRQQVPIRIVISPRDEGGNFVDVPEEEILWEVGLADY